MELTGDVHSRSQAAATKKKATKTKAKATTSKSATQAKSPTTEPLPGDEAQITRNIMAGMDEFTQSAAMQELLDKIRDMSGQCRTENPSSGLTLDYAPRT